jgi:hypothetical protein
LSKKEEMNGKLFVLDFLQLVVDHVGLAQKVIANRQVFLN